MTYAEVMTAIKKNDLKAIYLISGEETYLADKIEQALLTKLLPTDNQDGLQICNGDMSIAELVNTVDTVPFFAERNIIVVRNTNLFKEKKQSVEDGDKGNKVADKLVTLLMDMPAYSVLILRATAKVDKRRKLYKTIVKYGCAVEVAPIRAWEVKDWLTEKLRLINRQLERTAFEYFVEAVSVMNVISLGFLEQEIDKLALYSEEKLITKQNMLNILASVPEVSIFSMLDAISDKNVKKALLLLSEQLSAGEHPLKMITMLSRHTRQLWLAKSLAQHGLPARQMAEQLGVVPFIAEKLAAKSRNFAETTLKATLIKLAEADYQLKSGQADGALLERIIIALCK